MDTRKEIVDVFLCHNGADKDWVRKLAEQIESETFDGNPSGRPLKVWFDEWDINVGENFIRRINQGLSMARYVAVVISPEFLRADWPTLEWTHVVCDDPTNKKGRIIPLFLRDYSSALNETADLPAPFKSLNWIDFRKPLQFKRSYLKLIRRIRDLPAERGKRRRPLAMERAAPIAAPEPRSSAAPDRVADVILGNLLPVESYPGTVWSAPTNARKNKDVWEVVKEPQPFILRGGRLYTFADLTAQNEPLRKVVDDADLVGDPIVHWVGNPDRWRWFIDLLHKSLRKHLGRLPIARYENRRYYFRPNRDGTARKWQNGPDPEREVAAFKPGVNGSPGFWVHQGADLRFQTLGDQIYLLIEPCYVFTLDGKEPLPGMRIGPLSMKWGGKERNAAILRHIMFWARTLTQAKPKVRIATGGKPIVISGIPAIARTKFGIEFDQIEVGSLLAQVQDELLQAATLASAEVGITASNEMDQDGDKSEEE